MLSKRSEIFAKEEEFLLKCLTECSLDSYNPESNPNGYVNCGTSVNSMCEKEIATWLMKDGIWEHQTPWQHYSDLIGHERVRDIVAKFLTKRMKASKPLHKENVRIVKGVTLCLEAMSFLLCDEGDIILTPTPTYARFFADMEERFKSKVVGVPLTENGNDRPFQLTVEKLEAAIVEQHEKGKNVKVFLLANPSNPLGEIYTEELVYDLMKLCAKYSIHFISDEIYALSVFDEKVKFKSILNFESFPDPQRTHLLWGMSKDFGLAGFRFGVIYSWNSDLLNRLLGMKIYLSVPAHIHEVAGKMLADTDWLDKEYFPKNMSRLKKAYEKTVAMFEDLGIKYLPASAGLYIWFNLDNYLPKKSFECEDKLFNDMFKEEKLYIVPGEKFFCANPGWYRLVFAVHPENLDEALKRLAKFLKARKSNKK